MRLSHLPLRVTTGAFILNSGLSKRGLEGRAAEGLPGSLKPTQDGMGLAKDVWLVGAGLALVGDGLLDGAKGAARSAGKTDKAAVLGR